MSTTSIKEDINMLKSSIYTHEMTITMILAGSSSEQIKVTNVEETMILLNVDKEKLHILMEEYPEYLI